MGSHHETDHDYLRGSGAQPLRDERLGGSERIPTDVLYLQAKRVDYWYTRDPEWE